MRIAGAESSFQQYLRARGLIIEVTTLVGSLEAMIDWYVAERAEDATSIEEDGDMLLCQWGTYDWGGGLAFEFGLTRQLVEAGDAEDESIHQLSLTFRFPSDARTEALGRRTKWCPSPLEATSFRSEVVWSADAAFVRNEVPIDVQLRFEVAG